VKTIIADVCDITMSKLSDDKIVFTAEAQLSSLSQKVDTQEIRGGIGLRLIFISRSGKNIELTVRNAIWDSDFLEVISGVSYEPETNSVFYRENNLLCQKIIDDTKEIDETREIDDTYEFNEYDSSDKFFNYLFGDIIENKIIINKIPKDAGIIRVFAKQSNRLTIPGILGQVYVADGTQFDGTYSNGTVTFDGIIDGAVYTCVYEINVTGQTLKIRTDKFPERYRVEYRTVEYSLTNNDIVSDIYFLIYNCLPSGDFDVSFENGKPVSPELRFTALRKPGSNELGRVVEVSR